MSKKGSFDLKVGLAEMLKGGVIMDGPVTRRSSNYLATQSALN